jgi:uncharacterized membrane protein YidH (DUF202 family)
MISIALIPGIIILLMIIMAVFLINGKGSFLIAGYNTMNKHEKEKHDKKAISFFTGWLLIFMSVGMIALFIGSFLDIEWLLYCGIALIIVIPISGAIYMNTSSRFKKNINNETLPSNENGESFTFIKKIAVIMFFVMVLTGIYILFYQGEKDPVVNIYENKINIKALYGLTIDISEIKNISLIEKSMREIGVGRRINGFGGIGEALKGNFRSENPGETLLFVQSKSIPTIRIERNDKKDIYLSFRNKEMTLDLYRRLLGFQ